MNRSVPWFWIAAAALLLLLPGPAGRLLLDLLGGLTLTLLLLPLLLGGAALIGWQILRSRLRTCEVCGVASLSADVCPACGSVRATQGPESAQNAGPSIDASQATITIEAVEVDGPDTV